MKKRGRVYLVGAGPGDPDLLTVKALRLIQDADVIVHDRLVSSDIMSLANPTARLIDVGKRPDDHPVPQGEIQKILIDAADSADVIVRLKGGDPFLFGRGGEELIDLVNHGIPVEVVPGVTAAQGCAASVGMPLTHRGLASGVRYLTGHCRSNLDLDHDWQGLADRDTTLVIYMGLSNIALIADRLVDNGLTGQTPVMAVSNATRPNERRLVARLDTIADAVERQAFTGPVLFVVGEVVRLATRSEEIAVAHLDELLVRHA